MRIIIIALLVMCPYFIASRRIPRHMIYGNCYDFNTSQSLDLARWMTGNWYEIQRYDNEFEKGAKCVEQVYFFDESSRAFDISFTMIYENSTRMMLGKGNYTILEVEINLQATFPHDSGISSFDVVATDFDKYSVVYSCLQTSNDPSLPEKQERLWVLSRNQTLDESTKQLVKSILQVNGTDLTRYFDDVDQEGCD